MEQLSLELDKGSSEAYLSGSVVRGSVLISPPKDETLKALMIECIGSLELTCSREGKVREVSNYRIFYWSCPLGESEKGQPIQLKGGRVTNFPFVCPLENNNCLSTTKWTHSNTSCEKTELKISYSLQACMKREWPKPDKSVSTTFIVKNGIEDTPVTFAESQSQDDECDLHLAEEETHRKKKKNKKTQSTTSTTKIPNYYTSNLNRGSIRGQVTMEKSRYACEEPLQLSIKTYNQCAAPIRMEVALVLSLSFDNLLLEGTKMEVKEIEVQKWKIMPSVQPWEIREWQKALGCVIPTVPPTTYGIVYTVHVRPVVESIPSQGWVSDGGLESKKLKCDLLFSFPLVVIDDLLKPHPSHPSSSQQNTATPILSPPSYDEAVATTSQNAYLLN